MCPKDWVLPTLPGQHKSSAFQKVSWPECPVTHDGKSTMVHVLMNFYCQVGKATDFRM